MDNLIFLPNKYERYTAALRNYIHRIQLTKGITDELILKFRKIHHNYGLYNHTGYAL